MDTEVVVVGLGACGSMVLWQLARRGLSVVGLEQFGVGHCRGSYAGDSRLFRSAVYEGPRYVPLLVEARELWLQLEAESGRHLYDECGALQIGESDTPSFTGAIEAAEAFDLPFEFLDAAALRKRFPQHRIENNTEALLDYRAGNLLPEASVLTAVEQAKALGAQVLTNTEVIDFDESGDRLVVVTSVGEKITTEKVVVTTGSWTLKLRPDLKGFLQILPFALSWFMPRNPELFTPDVFPAFIRDEAGVHVHGTPTHDGYSVKAAVDPLWGSVTSPDDLPELTRDEQIRISGWAQSFLPNLNPEPVRYSIHHDLCTPSGLPIISLDDDGRYLLMTAFSGRGFKFAPAYGRVAADLLTGTPTDLYDMEFALDSHRR